MHYCDTRMTRAYTLCTSHTYLSSYGYDLSPTWSLTVDLDVIMDVDMDAVDVDIDVIVIDDVDVDVDVDGTVDLDVDCIFGGFTNADACV